MKREHLYRGRCIKINKFVEGSLLKLRSEGYDSRDGQRNAKEPHDKYFIVPYSTSNTSRQVLIEVDPETIGECTGLTDRNGNKIFDGDILHVNGWGKFKVVFCEALFGVKDFNETGDTYDYTLRNILENWDGVEIIGNIHDNPELVGGGE